MNPTDPTAFPASDTLGRATSRLSGSTLWKSLMVLFKARVVLLLLFAAVGGAFVASDGWPGTWNLITLVIPGAMAAAGASAINQYLEQELDARMERTRQRPLASRALMGRMRAFTFAVSSLQLSSTFPAPSFTPAFACIVIV